MTIALNIYHDSHDALKEMNFVKFDHKIIYKAVDTYFVVFYFAITKALLLSECLFHYITIIDISSIIFFYNINYHKIFITIIMIYDILWHH